MELIAVKKNSETISTLPFNVMTVLLSTEVMVCEAGENGRFLSFSGLICVCSEI